MKPTRRSGLVEETYPADIVVKPEESSYAVQAQMAPHRENRDGRQPTLDGAGLPQPPDTTRGFHEHVLHQIVDLVAASVEPQDYRGHVPAVATIDVVERRPQLVGIDESEGDFAGTLGLGQCTL